MEGSELSVTGIEPFEKLVWWVSAHCDSVAYLTEWQHNLRLKAVVELASKVWSRYADIGASGGMEECQLE